MKKSAYALLFFFGLIVALGAASLQTNPGYMDSFYYFYGGQQLARGEGFWQMFLWNYLGDPAGLPYPSHTYWMPLPSLAATLGIWLFSGWLPAFDAAQVVFVVLAASIPPLSAALSYALHGRKNFAVLTGILAGFTGFYMPFITAADGFAIYMILGALFFIAYLRLNRFRYLLLGILAGLLHLARADGILWLGMAFAAIVLDQFESERFTFKEVFQQVFTVQFARRAAVAVLGYLAVMWPWYGRNLSVFGSLMPPDGSRTLWVLDYNELFSYPASILTPERWWASGLGAILTARLKALGINLQTSFASMGMILPGVLALLGAWRYRTKKVIWLGWVAWGVLFAVMTLLFPFSSERGSYFHSGAAFVPLILALTPVGIDVLTAASLRRFKTWKDEKIRPFYVGVLVVFSFLFSVVLYFSGVVGFDEDQQGMIWNQAERQYAAVDAVLSEMGVPENEAVITANPPGFAVVTGRPSFNVPDGGVDTLTALAQDYGVRWVLVEESTPEGLEFLYESPRDAGKLKYLQTIEGVHLFVLEE